MTEQQLAAMRQALEALIAASGHVNNEVFVKVMMARDALNDALRTAIEQAETAPVQEPVATFDIAVNERTAAINYDYRKHKLVSGTPLYTTPPAAQPAVPQGYALIGIDVLKAWGKYDEVSAACCYPLAAPEKGAA
jgi:hypothetical protein